MADVMIDNQSGKRVRFGSYHQTQRGHVVATEIEVGEVAVYPEGSEEAELALMAEPQLVALGVSVDAD